MHATGRVERACEDIRDRGLFYQVSIRNIG